MKITKFYGLIFSVLLSLTATSQKTVKNEDSIRACTNFLFLPNIVELEEIKVFENVDSLTILNEFKIRFNGATYNTLYCSINSVPYTVEWYDVGGRKFVSKKKHLLIQQTIRDLKRPIDHRLLAGEIEKMVPGVKNIQFEEGHAGFYHDKWFKKKRVAFVISLRLIQKAGSYPEYYNDDLEYLELDKLKSLKDDNVQVMLVFQSQPADVPYSINQQRLIYIDLKEQKVRSSEIRSQFYYPIYN